MAKGRKTGGRDFVPGDPRAGRPKGVKDKVPHSLKASLKRIYEELVGENEAEVKEAIRKKLLLADNFHVQTAIYYLDGKPTDQVHVTDDRPTFMLILGPRRDPLAEPEEPLALPSHDPTP